MNQQRKAAASGGMTLVELMVVVAIVAILASVAYPSYREQVMRSQRAEAKAALLDTAQRLEKCFTRRHTYVGCNEVVDHQTESGRYFIDVTPLAQTFTITAEPRKSQRSDTKCGTLSIDNRDQKGQSATGGTLEKCWSR